MSGMAWEQKMKEKDPLRGAEVGGVAAFLEKKRVGLRVNVVFVIDLAFLFLDPFRVFFVESDHLISDGGLLAGRKRLAFDMGKKDVLDCLWCRVDMVHGYHLPSWAR